MKKISWIIFFCIFALAFFLRFYHFENNSPFDWDQDRDYGQVREIASGHLIILGPVAKGVGGFYLGSLYYYLLYPGYYYLHGSLAALPLTSLTIDAILAGLIYLLLWKIFGKRNSFFLALLWATSWFLLSASRVSWNVALVPIWSLFTLYGLLKTIDEKSVKHFYLLGLLTGLSVHIHVAAIPVIPLLLLIFWKKLHFSVKTWAVMLILALIPCLPLIFFDIKHQFLNLHLLRAQMSSQITNKTKFIPMIVMTITKLGKVISGIFLSKFADNILLGLLIIAMSIKSFWFDQRLLQKISAATILISTLLIIILHDYGFPEYYFAPAYLAICIVVFGNLPKYLLYPLLGVSLFLNIRSYTTEPSGFGLQVKTEIVNSLLEFKEPIDLTYAFDPGRDGGLKYLVELKGLSLDPESRTRIILSDKVDSPLYIDGELARDVVQIGKIKTALYIVQ